MAELNVYHDALGRTLTVWFDRPQTEYSCEETGEEVILMKDRAGRVIGFERLNYPGHANEPVRLSFDSVSLPAMAGS